MKSTTCKLFTTYVNYVKCAPNGDIDCQFFHEIYTFRNSHKTNYCAINDGKEVQTMSPMK